MTEQWVEVEWLVAEPAERRDDLPEDTRRVAYRARIRGLASDPTIGDAAEVLTATGRRQVGTVVSIRPGYTHSFGDPLDPWVRMRESIRAMLQDLGEQGAG
jgi:2-amino-4-ketopentanoate thiolase alpha subunit